MLLHALITAVCFLNASALNPLRALQNNVKKAFRQLKGKYQSPQRLRHRGVIAIDITKLVNPNFLSFVQPDEAALDAGLSQMVDNFIATHERLWQQKQRDKKTIGVMLRISVYGCK